MIPQTNHPTRKATAERETAERELRVEPIVEYRPTDARRLLEHTLAAWQRQHDNRDCVIEW